MEEEPKYKIETEIDFNEIKNMLKYHEFIIRDRIFSGILSTTKNKFIAFYVLCSGIGIISIHIFLEQGLWLWLVMIGIFYTLIGLVMNIKFLQTLIVRAILLILLNQNKSRYTNSFHVHEFYVNFYNFYSISEDGTKKYTQTYDTIIKIIETNSNFYIQQNYTTNFDNGRTNSIISKINIDKGLEHFLRDLSIKKNNKKSSFLDKF